MRAGGREIARPVSATVLGGTRAAECGWPVRRQRSRSQRVVARRMGHACALRACLMRRPWTWTGENRTRGLYFILSLLVSLLTFLSLGLSLSLYLLYNCIIVYQHDYFLKNY